MAHPRAGKTHDLEWLASQPGATEVVGVEFVQAAVEAFAAEHPALAVKKAAAVGPYKSVQRSANGKLTLLCGDVFKLPATPQFSRVWDRAALVALDPPTRKAYVARIAAALAPRGLVLLQVLDRAEGPPAARAMGPPFSVPEAEVQALYGGAFDIKKLESCDAMASNPRFKAAGLTKVLQVTYLLTKKA